MMFLAMTLKFSACLIAVTGLLQAGPVRFALPVATVSATSPAIVIGFVGGFIRHDNIVHSEVQLAARLRKEYASSTVVDTFENRNGDKAYREIISLLDANHDGTLSSEEKRSARIIIYGHSWGASEGVTLARRLEKDGIPVLLTVQVDSVAKIGETDGFIPANVTQAANFYQLDGLLHGAPQIRAADATRTQILGNFRFSYQTIPYSCTGYPWYNRIFMKAHVQIECDPEVWNQVESLIRSQLSPTAESGSLQ
jgi:hypothetical protein